MHAGILYASLKNLFGQEKAEAYGLVSLMHEFCINKVAIKYIIHNRYLK